MKVELTTYLEPNGLTLKVIPETPAEKDLLRGFGKHGKLSVTDGELWIEWFLEKAF